MRTALPVMFSALALACFLAATPGQAAETHTVLTPSDVQWGPAPASLPPGAEVAILFGDPSKEGPFAMRAKFPKGYSIPPHTHPAKEVVTVISGTFHLGMGETADESKLQTLPAAAASSPSIPAWPTTPPRTRRPSCRSTRSDPGGSVT